MKRTDILDALVSAVENEDGIIKVYKGVLPPVPKVKSFPSVAFAIEKETRERVNVPGCQFQSVLNIVGMVYTKADKIDYVDTASDIIGKVEDAIQTDSNLNSLVIDMYVKQIAQDGGLLYPYELSELNIVAYYRE